MKKKVLVVDDSILMQKVISDIIKESQDFYVVGTAGSGEEALNKFTKLEPDIVTLDFEMPGENGLIILEKILSQKTVPVLMVSAHTKEGAEITLKALEMGAADFLTKPSGTVSIDLYDLKGVLIEKLRSISQMNVAHARIRRSFPQIKHSRYGRGLFLAIGTSTGGVRALHEMMPAIPIGAGLKGLIVIHMPAGFTQSLADRLNNLSKVVIREARQNDLILDDQFLIAPGGFHTVVVKEEAQIKVGFYDAPPQYGLKPCADILFTSVSKIFSNRAVGIVLTGMGHDGAQGIGKIKDNGGITIAEDPQTAIAPGMPRAAIKTGKIDYILRLEEIPRLIMELNSASSHNGESE